MKISKLFHWLYAVLMFLPVFAIGTTCLINTFNMSAKEESEVVYKYETNEVNSSEDLIEGNIYKFNLNNIDFPTTTNYAKVEYLQIETLSSSATSNQNLFNTSYYSQIGFFNYNGTTRIYFLNNSSNGNIFYNTSNIINIDIVYNDTLLINNITYNNFSKCENLPIESVNSKNISNTFYKAIEQVENSTLFNWAYDSFLVVPFTSIFTLFGVPTNSVIMLMLSYWLSISLIWLVFDLVMYLPNLVHSWIDKGGIE